MVTILEQPGAIELSNNQLVYRFLAADAFGTPYRAMPSKADLSSPATGYPAGSQIIINWTEPDGSTSSVTFSAVNTPTQDNQIQSNNSGTPGIAYFQAVAEKIQAHPQINPLFSLSAASDDPVFLLQIAAIDTDPDWTISFQTIGISGASSASIAAIPDNTPEFYKVKFEAYLEMTDGTFDLFANLELTPDPNSRMSADIRKDIHKKLKESYTVPPIPSYDQTDPFLPDTVRKYYVRYKEEYDGAASTWKYVEIRKVMFGGINKQRFSTYDFFGSIGENNSILTWYPDLKRVSDDQPEYLSWFNYTDDPQIVYIQVELFGPESQTNSLSKFDALEFEVPSKEICVFPVGYAQLGLQEEDFDIRKYKVRVAKVKGTPTEEDVFYSQSRTYYPDYTYYKDKRYILYSNGFYMPQVLRSLGALDVSLDIDRTMVEKSLAINYKSLESETTQTDQQFVNQFNFRSGYHSYAEVEALQELLIYNHAFWIEEEGYLPINIIDNKFKLGNPLESLRKISFRAVPRLLDHNYSNIHIPSSTSGIDGAWGDNPFVLWGDDQNTAWGN